MPLFQAVAETDGSTVIDLLHYEIVGLCEGLYQVFAIYQTGPGNSGGWSPSSTLISALVFDRSTLVDWHKPFTKRAQRDEKKPPLSEFLILGPTFYRRNPFYNPKGTAHCEHARTLLYGPEPFREGAEPIERDQPIERATLEPLAGRLPIVWDEVVEGVVKLIRGKSEKLRFYHRIGVNSTDLEERETVLEEIAFKGPREYIIAQHFMSQKLLAAEANAEVDMLAQDYRRKRRR